MSYTLVVVDMQPYYPAARDKRTIDNVLALIKKAKQRNMPILAIKFAVRGPNKDSATMHLNALIETEIHNYHYGYFVHKFEVGGGAYIKNSNHPIIEDKFVVCGVNTLWCVRETAFGLKKYYPKAEVIVDLNACNDADTQDIETWQQAVEQDGVIAHV